VASLRADIVVTNANVLTLDARGSRAGAVGAIGERLVYVGSAIEAADLIGPETRVIDAAGKTLLPGLIDAHVHHGRTAVRMARVADVSFSAVQSISQMLAVLRQKASTTAADDWVMARGSGNADKLLAEGRLPTRAELDQAVPNLPALVVFPHIGVANSLALDRAGITRDTVNPPSGTIERDSLTGEPTGLLLEYPAVELVEQHAPHRPLDFYIEAIRRHIQAVLATGTTTVHDMMEDPYQPDAIMRAYQALLRSGSLDQRIVVYPFVHPGMYHLDHLLEFGIESGFGNNWLKLGGVKLPYDGGISGRLSYFYEPYEGEPNNFGFVWVPMDILRETSRKAHRAGVSVCIHAYGDRALDDVLDMWDGILAEFPRENHRHRIEHGGNWLMTPERIARVKRLGLILVPNMAYLRCRGDLLTAILGARRMARAFPARTLLEEGVLFASGSDASAGAHAVSPLRDIGASVARLSESGRALAPEEALTPLQALRLHTVQAAYAAFEEHIKGSLEVGKLADMALLAADPLKCSPSEIADIPVDMTIVGGKVRYERGS
jgi:predicted amidohydrolase YtcJ